MKIKHKYKKYPGCHGEEKKDGPGIFGPWDEILISNARHLLIYTKILFSFKLKLYRYCKLDWQFSNKAT